MKRDKRGIERAREMRRWNKHRGGHAPAPDLFQTHEAGAYDSSCLDWFASLRLRNLSPATIETYRWALLRYRKWLLAHHQGSCKRISSLLTADHVNSFHQHLIVEQATARTRGYLLANLKRLSHWLTANLTLILERDIGTHQLQDIKHADSGGVDPHMTQQQIRPWRDTGCHQEKGRRRNIGRHVNIHGAQGTTALQGNYPALALHRVAETT